MNCRRPMLTAIWPSPNGATLGREEYHAPVGRSGPGGAGCRGEAVVALGVTADIARTPQIGRF